MPATITNESIDNPHLMALSIMRMVYRVSITKSRVAFNFFFGEGQAGRGRKRHLSSLGYFGFHFLFSSAKPSAISTDSTEHNLNIHNLK